MLMLLSIMMAMSFCFMDAFRKKPIYPHPLYHRGTFLENGKCIEKDGESSAGRQTSQYYQLIESLQSLFVNFPVLSARILHPCFFSDKPCLRVGKSVSTMSRRAGTIMQFLLPAP
jgi:hypothetical protein